MSDYRKIIIGELTEPPKIFNMYEIWITFDTGDANYEMAYPDKVLDRVNAWRRACDPTTENFVEVMGDITFNWPVYDHGVAAPPVSVDVYYYDVHGKKHFCELE